jgi:hypothetical protein
MGILSIRTLFPEQLFGSDVFVVDEASIRLNCPGLTGDAIKQAMDFMSQNLDDVTKLIMH